MKTCKAPRLRDGRRVFGDADLALESIALRAAKLPRTCGCPDAFFVMLMKWFSTRTVVIVINKDKSMMINQEVTDDQRLGPRLEEIFKTRAERVVFVKGDPDLEYQYVAKAIDIAHGAGIDKVGLMTPQMEAGQ